MSPPASKYHFAKHVRVCETEDYVVLLDIRRNRFLGLSRADMQVLARQLLSSAPPGGSPVMRTLLDQGMLSTTKASGATPALPAAVRALHDGFMPFRNPVSARDSWKFIRSFVPARITATTGNIESFVAESKRKALERPDSTETLASLVAVYAHCRTWFFRAAGACLLDSLTLNRFLAYFGVASAVVVGVRSCPFTAHAWVQVDEVVVNDRPEVVRAYRPIYWS